MTPVLRVDWDGAEMQQCFPVGPTSDLGVMLRDARGDHRLRILSPDTAKRVESAPLVVGGRLQACDLTQDGSRVFWYDGDDLRAVDLDRLGSADVSDHAWRLEGHTLASLTAIDPAHVVLCRAGQFPPVLSLDLAGDSQRSFDAAPRPVTQLAPRFAASPRGALGAFAYVFDAIEIWELRGSGQRPWLAVPEDREVLAGSPFVAAMQFSADAKRLAANSAAARDGSGRSRLRSADLDGGNLRELDTSAYRKELALSPDLTRALLTSWEPSDRVFVMDASSGAILAETKVGFVPRQIVVSGDGGAWYAVSKREAVAFPLA